LQGPQIVSQALAAGETFNLADKLPWVVTCGALTRGVVMVWDPDENVIGCHSFR
jgi:hypothetical protein